MTSVEFYRKTEQMRKVILELLDLCKNIEEDFLAKYPNFFNTASK